MEKYLVKTVNNIEADASGNVNINGSGGTPAGSSNQIQINQSGSFFADSTFQKSDADFNVGLNHTQQSAVTFTGSGLDDLTLSGTFSGTYPTTYTVTVASAGTPDTFDWTDGTNSGTGVSMSTSPTLLSNGISITFGADTGHTLSDSWTWTYSTANQNVLDFSNNDYKFQSTFGTDTFGYQIGDNLLGYGLKGSVNTWSNGSDFSLSGTYLQGNTLTTGTTIQIGSASAASLLEIDKSYTSISDGTDTGSYSLRVNELTLANTIGGIDYGIEQSAGAVTLGNLSGGNNTKITIDDVAQTINFNGEYSFPFADGTSGQTLVTDGAGTLSWASAGGGSPITIGTAGNTLYSSGLSGTGQGDTSTGQNIILGVSAGASASGAYNVNFLGQNAGNGATGASSSNFLGSNAGNGATGASSSNFLGSNAGKGATSASNSNFLGLNAGYYATSAYQSNFFGPYAGFGATSASNSNFFGPYAGNGATSASYSNFFGYEAGLTASSAGTSNFIGYLAGRLATNAANSNFIGNGAGSGATNAANSIFIGKFAGSSDTVSITGASTDSAILIGSSTSTGGFKNSIAIGNGATNTAANQFLVSAPTQQFTSMTFITTSAGFFKRDAGVVDSRVTTVAYGSTTNLTAGHYDIQVTTSTGATTINLPTGTTSPIGTTYIIKDLDAIAVTSNITIDAGSGNTINAATIAQTYVIAISGECVKLKKVTSTAWAIE